MPRKRTFTMPDPKMLRLPAVLRRLRIEAGYTQETFGKAISISRNTISRCERGLWCPEEDLLTHICTVLHLEEARCHELRAAWEHDRRLWGAPFTATAAASPPPLRTELSTAPGNEDDTGPVPSPPPLMSDAAAGTLSPHASPLASPPVTAPSPGRRRCARRLLLIATVAATGLVIAAIVGVVSLRRYSQRLRIGRTEIAE